MISRWKFLFLCFRAYRLAESRGTGLAYVAQTRQGVPECTVFVGFGRESWRVSVRAVEEFRP